MQLSLERIRNSPRLVEVTGLLLTVVGLVMLLALMSYRATDANFFTQPGHQPTQNVIGKVGATGAEALLQLVGVAAVAVPIAMFLIGWDVMRKRPAGDLGMRLVGQILLLVALCSLLELLFGTVTYGGEAFPAGGVLGATVAGWLRNLLNRVGALIFSATLLASVMILTTRSSFARWADWVSRAAVVGWARARERAEGWLESRRSEAAKREAARPAPAPPAVAPVRPATIRLEPEQPSASPAEAEPKPPARKKRKVTVPAAQQALPMEAGRKGYALPPLELLNEGEPQKVEGEQDLLERARRITEKLREFAVHGNVVAVHPGPVVTTFEFKPEAGIKYSKITGMTEDLSLALRAESVRIDRMPGRATVGVEVPNRHQETIYPRELFASEHFQSSRSKLALALGKDISGDVFTADLDRMPHLLIAGATGSGKSVGLNAMICSLLYRATPDDVRMIMIDTKMIELGVYEDIPHLLIPVVTDPKHATTALMWAVREMEQRYRKLASTGVRNIGQFNELLEKEPDRAMEDPKTGEAIPLEHLPYIVIVIDELADLMMVSSADVERSIMRLAQMARAVGIHLIIATQRPSVDVITGTIKANFPSRIAFRVSQRVDSRTIIDQQGAEHLLGRGDMLFLSSGAARLLRLHGGFISEAELHRITSFLKKSAEPIYDESVLREESEQGPEGDLGERDDMYDRAVKTVIEEGKCSITLIQRRLQLGYARAARIVDMMEREGVVSAGEGAKPREILVGPDFLEQMEARQ